MASLSNLQSLLNQATDPSNVDERWDCIQDFYQLVNQDADGPQIAVRLLAHKIQSPQEKEALQALTVLEACMNHCGKRFRSEVAKFRFLNELIKVLTPKYFGAWTPQKVKERVTEVLYGWTLWLKEEQKIQEAYRMLKKQGVVKEDPQVSLKMITAPPAQRSTQSVFDQEKAALLSRLLKSACPEDLENANKLIKTTVKDEQEKAEKVSKREDTLKEVESSTKDLRELLERQAISGTMLELSDDVTPLYERCDRLKPTLFRLASDTVDDDEALSQILAANDELTLVLSAYRDTFLGRGRRCAVEAGAGGGPALPTDSAPSAGQVKNYHLIDFSALDLLAPPTESGDELLKWAPGSPQSCCEELIQLHDDLPTEDAVHSAVLRAQGCGTECTHVEATLRPTTQSGLLRPSPKSFTSPTTPRSRWQQNPFAGPEPPPKLQEQQSHILDFPVKSEEPSGPRRRHGPVPVDPIKASHLEPRTLYDRGGLHVSLHFARDTSAGAGGDTALAVVSTVNTSGLRVSDYTFQVAVPKTMWVKVQPASGTHLAAYNPVRPPPTISQVLHLTNPSKQTVRLRYQLTLTHGDQQLKETREIHDFPDWTKWTAA